MKSLNYLGRAFFAISMAALGLQYVMHLISAKAPALGPPWSPVHPFMGCLTAIVMVAAAVSIATRIQMRCLAIALAVVILIRVLIVYLPKLVANVHDPGPWTSGFELLALCGAALVLAGFISLGRVLFAASLGVFGVQHFMYARFIATLVPSWIPGQLFWAYFVGAAFVAAAVAIATGVMGRLAASLLGLMFLLWVLLLHSPRVAGAAHNGNEWTSLFVALAMSGAAFLVAETLGSHIFPSA
jgi:uncharacterized membrane protein